MGDFRQDVSTQQVVRQNTVAKRGGFLKRNHDTWSGLFKNFKKYFFAKISEKVKITCRPCSRHKGSWPPSRHRACLQTTVDENDENKEYTMIRIGHQVPTVYDCGKLLL